MELQTDISIETFSIFYDFLFEVLEKIINKQKLVCLKAKIEAAAFLYFSGTFCMQSCIKLQTNSSIEARLRFTNIYLNFEDKVFKRTKLRDLNTKLEDTTF